MPQLSTRPYYLGIDPGKKGGIAIINSVGKPIHTSRIPDALYDLWNVFVWIKKNYSEIHAGIEKVHSMPKQGVASTFTFGVGYGSLLMALTAAGIGYVQYTPQDWQKRIGISKTRKQLGLKGFKRHLISVGKAMYPELSLWQGPIGFQESACDALLIATCRYKEDRR